MWRLGMSLESRLIPVDLVEPYPVRVIGILDHVEPEAPRLLVDRATGILNQLLDELVFVSCFNLNRGDYNVYILPCSITLR